MKDSIKHISILREYVCKLNDLAIYSTDDLIANGNFDKKRKTLAEKLNINEIILQKAIAISDLSRIKGIGIKAAETLVEIYDIRSITDLSEFLNKNESEISVILKSHKIYLSIDDIHNQIEILPKIVFNQPPEYLHAHEIMMKNERLILKESQKLQKKKSKIYFILTLLPLFILAILISIPIIKEAFIADKEFFIENNIKVLLYSMPVFYNLFKLTTVIFIISLITAVLTYYPGLIAGIFKFKITKILFPTNELSHKYNQIDQISFFNSFKTTLRKVSLPLAIIFLGVLIITSILDPIKMFSNCILLLYFFFGIYIIILTVLQFSSFKIDGRLTTQFYKRYYLKNILGSTVNLLITCLLVLIIITLIFHLVDTYHESFAESAATMYSNYASQHLSKVYPDPSAFNSAMEHFTSYYNTRATAFDINHLLNDMANEKDLFLFISNSLAILLVYFVLYNTIEYLLILGKRSLIIFAVSILLTFLFDQFIGGLNNISFSAFLTMKTLIIFACSFIFTLTVDAFGVLMEQKSICHKCLEVLYETYFHCPYCGQECKVSKK